MNVCSNAGRAHLARDHAAGAAAVWSLAARAQQSGPVRRVGVLMNGAATEAAPQWYVAAFL